MVSTQKVTFAAAEATLQEATVDAEAAAAGPDKTENPSPEGRAQVVKGYKWGVNFQRSPTLILLAVPSRASGRCTSSTSWSRTSRGRPCPPGVPIPSGPSESSCSPPGGTGWRSRGRWRTSTIGTCCRPAIADRMIGDLIKKLRATGMFDCSLLVVTADHGLAFNPGTQRPRQPRRGPPPRTYCGCRPSSSAPASAARRSPTSTGSTSTSCPRSPTSWGSPFPAEDRWCLVGRPRGGQQAPPQREVVLFQSRQGSARSSRAPPTNPSPGEGWDRPAAASPGRIPGLVQFLPPVPTWSVNGLPTSRWPPAAGRPT